MKILLLSLIITFVSSIRLSLSATNDSQTKDDNSTDSKQTTMLNNQYLALNNTALPENQDDFLKRHRSWDYKLLLPELDDIWGSMLRKQETKVTERGLRAYLDIFLKDYDTCDSDKDNQLNLDEFTKCMSLDEHLKQIISPPAQFASKAKFSNSTEFHSFLFTILDDRNKKLLNFHDYLILRLAVYSWQKCTSFSPFIEEVGWECAVDIISDHKTFQHSTLRSLFYLVLELGNNSSDRHMDFSTFLMGMQSIRLFSKMNASKDNGLTMAELMYALDSNILPERYGKETGRLLFYLENQLQGGFVNYNKNAFSNNMEVQSFIFFDFALRLFHAPVAKPFFLNVTEFESVLASPLFPATVLNEINKVPQVKITKASYQMFAWHNTTKFNSETDFFEKFIQLGVSEEAADSKKSNTSYVANEIFKVLDTDEDGFINFAEFGTFFEISWLFSKFDTGNAGRILCGKLATKLKEYDDFPKLAGSLKSGASRFNSLPIDLYLDLLYVIEVIRVDEVMRNIVRMSDQSVVNEVEMRKMLAIMTLDHVPDAHLDKCVRGLDKQQIPKYEWECSFLKAIELTGRFWENVKDSMFLKEKGLSNVNTVINNEWPVLKNANSFDQLVNSTEAEKLNSSL